VKFQINNKNDTAISNNTSNLVSLPFVASPKLLSSTATFRIIRNSGHQSEYHQGSGIGLARQSECGARFAVVPGQNAR
jgi:hypothetical protein